MGDQMERRNYRNCHVHDGSCDLLEGGLDSYYPYVDLSVSAGCFPALHMVWAHCFCCSLTPGDTGAHHHCSET